MENKVILYQPNETIKVDVRLDGETVWLTQEQMCVLFGRERSVITKHIRNVFKEGELDERVSCAKFAPDALMVPDGKGGFVQNLHKTPSVGEVRAIRHQIAKECGNDPLKITRYATEVARKFLSDHSSAA